MPAKRTIKPVTPASTDKPVKPVTKPRAIATASGLKPAATPLAAPSGPAVRINADLLSPASAQLAATAGIGTFNPDAPAVIAQPLDADTTKAASDVAAVAATLPRGLARDAAGIVAARTNFDQYSDRDSAYLAFFGSVLRAHGHSATLRQIHDAGVTRSGMPDRKRYNPNYTGSGKATDVGAVNRLIAAGYLTKSADGNTLTATVLATGDATATPPKAGNAIYLGTKA